MSQYLKKLFREIPERFTDRCKAKCVVVSILPDSAFPDLNKSLKDYIINFLWHILSIKGKINFLQLGRFSLLGEQRFQIHFKKEFDFWSSNLINQVFSEGLAIVLDSSYIPKAGKSHMVEKNTVRVWAESPNGGWIFADLLLLMSFKIRLSISKHSKHHRLPIWSTMGLSLLIYDTSMVTENAKKFKDFSGYMVADAYFSKKPFVDAVLSAELHFISRLWGDSVLRYRFYEEQTSKKGRPKMYDGFVDIKNLDTDYLSLDLSTEKIKIYSAVVNSKAFKRYKKLAVSIFYKDGKEIARKLYFSTDLEQVGDKIVKELIFYSKIAA
jgi:hypothetical protein